MFLCVWVCVSDQWIELSLLKQQQKQKQKQKQIQKQKTEDALLICSEATARSVNLGSGTSLID